MWKMAAREALKVVVVYCIALFYGFLVSLQLLWNIIRKPSTLRKVKHSMPECLLNPDLGEHCYLRTESGLRFHYVAKGDPAKPLMLFVHGFPEFWYSWRHQIKAFADSYRVVAIDLRGYGESDKPEGKDKYQTKLLVNDLKEIITGLGYSSCVLVGHDWGGILCWGFAHQYPNYVTKLIILNVPHPRLLSEYIEKSWSQFKKSWYIFLFQLPYLPELMMGLDDCKSLKMLVRKKDVSHYHGNLEEDSEAYKHAFSQPGAFTPPINYYRAHFGNARKSGYFSSKIKAPTLVIWGTGDVALEEGSLQGTDQYVEDVTIRYVEGAGHFVQQSDPEAVNKLMEEYLMSHSFDVDQ